MRKELVCIDSRLFGQNLDSEGVVSKFFGMKELHGAFGTAFLNLGAWFHCDESEFSVKVMRHMAIIYLTNQRFV